MTSILVSLSRWLSQVYLVDCAVRRYGSSWSTVTTTQDSAVVRWSLVRPENVILE